MPDDTFLMSHETSIPLPDGFWLCHASLLGSTCVRDTGPGEPGEVYTRPHLLRLMLSSSGVRRFMTPAREAPNLNSHPESQPETPIYKERTTKTHDRDTSQNERNEEDTELAGREPGSTITPACGLIVGRMRTPHSTRSALCREVSQRGCTTLSPHSEYTCDHRSATGPRQVPNRPGTSHRPVHERSSCQLTSWRQ